MREKKKEKKKIHRQQTTPPPPRTAPTRRGCSSTLNDTVKWYFWLLGGPHAPLKVCRHSHAATFRPHVTKLYIYIIKYQITSKLTE